MKERPKKSTPLRPCKAGIVCLRRVAAERPRRIRHAHGLAPGERGQATVEFALVAAAFLSIGAACAALWRAFEGGLFVEHALLSASHHVAGIAPGLLADIFLY